MSKHFCSRMEMEFAKHNSNEYSIELRFSACNDDSIYRSDTFPLKLNIAELTNIVRDGDISKYGKNLTAQVFEEHELKKQFKQCFDNSLSQNSILRIQIVIKDQVPELNNIVWEALCDPESKEFLSTNENVWLSRYISSQNPQLLPPSKKEHIKACIAVSNPNNLFDYHLPPIDINGEFSRAKQSFGELSLSFLPQAKKRVTLNNIIEEFRTGIDIFYLVCHGLIDNGKPIIVLENDQGDYKGVSGEKFVSKLSRLSIKPRLIVFASCESAINDQAVAFSALGPMLIKIGIPAVLAINGKISMESVRLFSPTFFRELMIDGQIDRAITVARNTISERFDFWTPVLFLRSESGELWKKTPSTSRFSREIPKLLPYTPNRIEQEIKLAEMIAKRNQIGNCPIIAIVPGDEYQCHDKFLDRIKEITLPKISALNKYQNVISVFRIDWPEHIKDISELHQRLQIYLSNAIMNTPIVSELNELQDVLARYPGPVVIGFFIPITDWNMFGSAIIHTCLELWDNWPELINTQDLLIFVFIKYTPSKQSLLGKIQKKKNDQLFQQFNQNDLLKKYNRIIFSVLPELTNVTRAQAEDWARQKGPQEYCDTEELLEKIREIFIPCNGNMPMEILAKKLKTFLAGE